MTAVKLSVGPGRPDAAGRREPSGNLGQASIGKGNGGQSTTFAFAFLIAQPGESDLLIVFQTLVSLLSSATEAANSLTPAKAWNEASG